MSIATRYRHTLAIRRSDPTGTLDDYGQPVTAEVTLATVPGLVQPKTAREMALTSQAGAAVSDHTGFIDPLAALDTRCWIEVDGARYDVVGVRDAAGRGHHLELDLRKVA